MPRPNSYAVFCLKKKMHTALTKALHTTDSGRDIYDHQGRMFWDHPFLEDARGFISTGRIHDFRGAVRRSNFRVGSLSLRHLVPLDQMPKKFFIAFRDDATPRENFYLLHALGEYP